MADIKPRRQLMLKFGGWRKLAELLPAPISTVQYWWDNDHIPSKRQQDVLNCALKNGIEASPADFFDQPNSVSHA